MAVTRCTVKFGPYRDVEAALAHVGLKGRIRPSHRVIETATGGDVITRDWIDFVIGPDATATVSLPHTNQDGVSPRGWIYELVWEGLIGSTPGDMKFALQVEAGATISFDKDLVPSVAAPIYVPIAASLAQVEAAENAASAASTSASGAATSAAGAATSAAASAADAATAATAATASASSASAAASSASAAATDADAAASNIAAAAASSAAAAASAGQSADAATASATSAGQAAGSSSAATLALNRQYTTAAIVGDDLVLTRDNGGQTTAGNVRGPKGDQGFKGDVGDLIPATTSTGVNGSVSITSGTFPSTRTWVLNGNVTISSIALGGAGVSGTTTLVIKQAASGGPYTVAWPATLEWAGDAPAPTVPTVANAELVVHLFWTGSATRAMVGGTFYP